MKKRPIRALLLLALPTLVVVITALVFMQYRIPTLVRIGLTANRAAFSVAETEWTPLLNAVRFESVTVQEFSSIQLNPVKLEVADPVQYIYSEGRYPESAWQPLELSSPVVIAAGEQILQPSFTLESSLPGLSGAGTLDQIWVNSGAEVNLEVSGDRGEVVVVRVVGQQSSAVLSLKESFQFMIEYCRVEGVTKTADLADSLTFRGELPTHSPAIEITGQPQSLVVVLKVSPELETNLFPSTSIPVTALDFTRQIPQGLRVTSLLKEGEITYPDHPEIEKVVFKASDFIGLDHLDEFYVERLELDRENGGIHLNLVGVAGHLRTGSLGASIDHRLTLYDVVSHSPRMVILFSMIIWVFPTTVGAYRLYKEFSK
jgi:hypothetical protein